MSRRIITVFEHDTYDFKKGDEKLGEALRSYYGQKGVPYYSLTYRGVKFNSYVGIIQVGNCMIEVLPKSDRNLQVDSEAEQNKWRNVLIKMLKTVNNFELKYTSYSNLRLRSNSLLDLYFELFVREVEHLLKTGLAKSYRRVEGNNSSLKGNLLFARNISCNYIHKERFYINYTLYDHEHIFNIILYKTLRMLHYLNSSPALASRIGALLLNFPEMPDIKVNELTFDRLLYTRKTIAYKKAIEISKFILLNFHPDLRGGRNYVLALMFDMNELWEKFVYVSLRRNVEERTKIYGQKSKQFWSSSGKNKLVRADIIIEKDGINYVLDTKWKILKDLTPTSDDLQQLFVYQEYYNSKFALLIYPGDENDSLQGKINLIDGYFKKNERYRDDDRKCCLVKIPVINDAINDISKWQKLIAGEIYKVLNRVS